MFAVLSKSQDCLPPTVLSVSARTHMNSYCRKMNFYLKCQDTDIASSCMLPSRLCSCLCAGGAHPRRGRAAGL